MKVSDSARRNITVASKRRDNKYNRMKKFE